MAVARAAIRGWWLATFALGCTQAPTEIVLRIETDIGLAREGGPLRTIEVNAWLGDQPLVIGPGPGMVGPGPYRLDQPGVPMPGEVVLRAASADEGRQVRVEVIGNLSGDVSIRREFAVHFSPRRTTLLEAFLADRCRTGIACPQGTTCGHEGVCEDIYRPSLPDRVPTTISTGQDASVDTTDGEEPGRADAGTGVCLVDAPGLPADGGSGLTGPIGIQPCLDRPTMLGPNVVAPGEGQGVLSATRDARYGPGLFVPRAGPTGRVLMTFSVLAEGSGFRNGLGWYNAGDTPGVVASRNPVIGCRTAMSECACPCTTGPRSVTPADSACTHWLSPNVALVDFDCHRASGRWRGGAIGFYLQTPEAIGHGGATAECAPPDSADFRVYASDHDVNGDGSPRLIALASRTYTDAFYLGWEDLLGTGDGDFDDLLVRVAGVAPGCAVECVEGARCAVCTRSVVHCVEGRPVCIAGEPESAGVACALGECSGNGTCCPYGARDCDGVAVNGCEVANIYSDVRNCGMCGRACSGTERCVSGTCRPTGYVAAQGPAGTDFVDACAAPGSSRVLVQGDDTAVLVSLPFAINWWGFPLPNRSIAIGTNGFMVLDATSASQAIQLTGTIPDPAVPNSVIAPLWSDLVLGTSGLCVATVGVSPDRRWVAQWSDARPFVVAADAGVPRLNFEVVLHEGSGVVDFVYGDMTGARAAAVGLEDPRGISAVGGCGATHCLPLSNTRVRFTPM